MSSAAKPTLADAAKVSELKDLGWKVEGDGPYSAKEQGGEKRELGPARSIGALHTQVMVAVGKHESSAKKPAGKTVKVPAEKAGENSDYKLTPENDKERPTQPILKGTEEAVFADMETAGADYRKTTMEILRLQKIQKTQLETLKPMMEKFRDELNVDPDTKEPYFTVDVEGEEVDIILEKKETESIKTRKHG